MHWLIQLVPSISVARPSLITVCLDQHPLSLSLVPSLRPHHISSFCFAAEPAINGTSNVLKAAKEFSQIKSVVVTSSFVSIVNLEPAHTQSHKVYNEQDWLPIEYEAADGDRDSRVWYCASKKLAEKKGEHPPPLISS